MMVWQLLQVRQLHNTPFILIGEMWADLVLWAKQYMLNTEVPLISPNDLLIPECVDTFEAAIERLQAAHTQWSFPTEAR